MDESNMIHMFTQQTYAIITPLMETTSNTCTTLAQHITRLNQALDNTDGQNLNVVVFHRVLA